jgi:hypothetical protein
MVPFLSVCRCVPECHKGLDDPEAREHLANISRVPSELFLPSNKP